MFVSNNCLFEDSKIVGLLHDILEDTDCSIAELESVVHENLIEAIQLLTKRKDEKYDDYIVRTEIKNLSLLPMGTIPPNPAELIASENFCSERIRKAAGSILTNKYSERLSK